MPSPPEKNATNEQPLDTIYLYQENACDQADTDLFFYVEAFELNYLENYDKTFSTKYFVHIFSHNPENN